MSIQSLTLSIVAVFVVSITFRNDVFADENLELKSIEVKGNYDNADGNI